MATLKVADYFGLDGIVGGIALGGQADILILPDQKRFFPAAVISKGRTIARDGELFIMSSRRRP